MGYVNSYAWKLGLRNHGTLWSCGEDRWFIEPFDAPPRMALAGSDPLKGEEALPELPADVIVYHVRKRADLERALPILRQGMAAKAKLWVGLPLRGSTDLDFDAVIEIAKHSGLVEHTRMRLAGPWEGIRFKARPN